MEKIADIRLAIFGCGTETETLYLPALRQSSAARVVLLVDEDIQRCSNLAGRFGIPNYAGDVQDDLYNLFDGAIVTLPPQACSPLCLKLLRNKKAVMAEQPTTFSVVQIEELIDAVRLSPAPFLLAKPREHLLSHRFTRSLLDHEILGKVRSFDVRIGNPELSSSKPGDNGGILAGAGVPVLNCLFDWLGDYVDVEYLDDAEGGVEANCFLTLTMRSAAAGIVELSCTRKLRNTAIIRFERGTLEIGLDCNDYKLTLVDQSCSLAGQIGALDGTQEDQSDLGLARKQIAGFLSAIRQGLNLENDAQLARSSAALIETCYRIRKPLNLSWTRFA
jgi:predicted dehydrogenase